MLSSINCISADMTERDGINPGNCLADRLEIHTADVEEGRMIEILVVAQFEESGWTISGNIRPLAVPVDVVMDPAGAHRIRCAGNQLDSRETFDEEIIVNIMPAQTFQNDPFSRAQENVFRHRGNRRAATEMDAMDTVRRSQIMDVILVEDGPARAGAVAQDNRATRLPIHADMVNLVSLDQIPAALQLKGRSGRIMD